MLPWYQASTSDVLKYLQTSTKGLSQQEAYKRLQHYGENEIQFKQKPAWLRFLLQFWDPMIAILLVTAFVTAPFPLEWWPIILLCALPSFICIELDKLIRSFRTKPREHEKSSDVMLKN